MHGERESENLLPSIVGFHGEADLSEAEADIGGGMPERLLIVAQDIGELLQVLGGRG